MRERCTPSYSGLFEPALIRGHPTRVTLDKREYLERGRAVALATALANGAATVRVGFPDADAFAPVRIAVSVDDRVVVRRGEIRRSVRLRARATAELVPLAGNLALRGTGPGYAGPLERRQGQPMRPDVARAFDRLEAAARADGVLLSITSAYRSDAEQAVLFARRPDPKWVARPGTSLHRYGTELDLGPPSAYAWLRANAARFHFVQRYGWEPWHWGFTLNAGSSAVIQRRGDGAGAVPNFVPSEFRAAIVDASQRFNVSAALLAAQIHAESNFNPFAVSPAGARGIAQFMPATARAYGLRDPHDPAAAIAAQARLMRDLLRRFSSVPLALAAYNAGPARVAACVCVPPIAETRGYVARILGLLGGAGEADSALAVRLVE